MIQVFYDSECGLCSKEINHYKKIAPKGVFEWCEIVSSAEKLESAQISVVSALKELHTRDKNGVIYVGVDSFILIWHQLPRWRFLGRFVQLPGVYPLTKWLYGLFASRRFKSLAHCQLADQNKTQGQLRK